HNPVKYTALPRGRDMPRPHNPVKFNALTRGRDMSRPYFLAPFLRVTEEPELLVTAFATGLFMVIFADATCRVRTFEPNGHQFL
ncbi:MAG: hypothetical protein J1E63_05655, partial [Muribaculaceae bacterium]|nr:hypothetical protein [Muribaculaceae bacterium]